MGKINRTVKAANRLEITNGTGLIEIAKLRRDRRNDDWNIYVANFDGNPSNRGWRQTSDASAVGYSKLFFMLDPLPV
jgi:hypothetical protein